MVEEYTKLPARRDLKNLQKYQRVHDENFHQDVFNMQVNDQIKHIAYHVAKISGYLGDYLDKLDHKDMENAKRIMDDIKNKRAVDLFALSVMLANRLNIDLEEDYFKRIKGIEEGKIKKIK